MRFPPHFIERLKNHFLVSEVIGRHIPLKRHGREFQACCPFHKEKSPSFTVNDEKAFYHCFGCGAHGDAIRFIQEYDKLTYPEAIERLAGEAGIPLPEFSPRAQAQAARETTLYDVMRAAAEWFEAQLHNSREAMAYLRGRHLSDDTLKTFHIGFAPAGREVLKQALLQKGFSENHMVEAGLLIRPDQGPTYDRFRARIMFPITDINGKVIAFGGRILGKKEDNVPKYLNSPETDLFKKGEILFNLSLARRPAANAGTMIVCEGYMDVIALHQAGIHNAVAPLGTAITENHLGLLWRFTDEPVLCLDGDAAGERAMLRALELALPLLKAGKSLKFSRLPAGEDPDTFVMKHGVQAMQKAIADAWPLSRVIWESYARELTGPEKKASVEKALMDLTERIQDGTVKNHYRAYFKDKLWPRYEASKRGGAKDSFYKQGKISQLMVANISDHAAIERAEKQLIALLASFPSLLHRMEVEEAFARMDLHNEESQHLRALLLDTSHALDPLDAVVLMQHLEKMNSAESFKSLLADETVSLPRKAKHAIENRDEEMMHALWLQMLGAYTLTRIEAEYRQAVTDMASHTTEEAVLRCDEIKKTLENARKEWAASFYALTAH